jgi:hypothetical protein
MILISYLYIVIYPFGYVIKLLLYLTIVIEGTKLSSVLDNANNKNHNLPNTRLSVEISTL